MEIAYLEGLSNNIPIETLSYRPEPLSLSLSEGQVYIVPAGYKLYIGYCEILATVLAVSNGEPSVTISSDGVSVRQRPCSVKFEFTDAIGTQKGANYQSSDGNIIIAESNEIVQLAQGNAFIRLDFIKLQGTLINY